MSPLQALARPPVPYRGAARAPSRGMPLQRPTPLPRQRAQPHQVLRRPPVRPVRRPVNYAPPREILAAVKSIPVLGTVVGVLSSLGDVLGIGASLSNVQCAPGNPNYPACACPGGCVNVNGTCCAGGGAPGAIGGGGQGGGGTRTLYVR